MRVVTLGNSNTEDDKNNAKDDDDIARMITNTNLDTKDEEKGKNDEDGNSKEDGDPDDEETPTEERENGLRTHDIFLFQMIPS